MARRVPGRAALPHPRAMALPDVLELPDFSVRAVQAALHLVEHASDCSDDLVSCSLVRVLDKLPDQHDTAVLAEAGKIQMARDQFLEAIVPSVEDLLEASHVLDYLQAPRSCLGVAMAALGSIVAVGGSLSGLCIPPSCVPWLLVTRPEWLWERLALVPAWVLRQRLRPRAAATVLGRPGPVDALGGRCVSSLFCERTDHTLSGGGVASSGAARAVPAGEGPHYEETGEELPLVGSNKDVGEWAWSWLALAQRCLAWRVSPAFRAVWIGNATEQRLRQEASMAWSSFGPTVLRDLSYLPPALDSWYVEVDPALGPAIEHDWAALNQRTTAQVSIEVDPFRETWLLFTYWVVRVALMETSMRLSPDHTPPPKPPIPPPPVATPAPAPMGKGSSATLMAPLSTLSAMERAAVSAVRVGRPASTRTRLSAPAAARSKIPARPFQARNVALPVSTARIPQDNPFMVVSSFRPVASSAPPPSRPRPTVTRVPVVSREERTRKIAEVKRQRQYRGAVALQRVTRGHVARQFLWRLRLWKELEGLGDMVVPAPFWESLGTTFAGKDAREVGAFALAQVLGPPAHQVRSAVAGLMLASRPNATHLCLRGAFQGEVAAPAAAEPGLWDTPQACVSSLGRWRSLTSLDLSACPGCGDKEFSSLAELPMLATLQVCGWDALTVDGVREFLCRSECSTVLPPTPPLMASRDTVVGVPSRFVVGQKALRCPPLRALNLAGCKRIDDDTVWLIGRGLPGLRDLCLFGCLRVTEKAAAGFGGSSSRLERMCIAGAYKFGDDAVRFLLTSVNPHLQLYVSPGQFSERPFETFPVGPHDEVEVVPAIEGIK
jgi:hypothetical protein